MKFSPRFLDEIRSRLTLSELIGKRVRLTRAGREYKACCPFHKEKTPSFYVNDDKGFYHCFGCGAHGDVVGWTMQHENRSFPEAIEQLAGLAGLEMPRQSPEDIRQAREEKDLYQLMNDATAFFEEQLRDGKNREAYQYIAGRGFEEETLCAFRVGYASADRQQLHAHLKELGYKDEQMITCGLIRKDKNGRPYSFFRERIMFPVTDKRGRVVAFGGRILPDHLRPPDRGDFTPPKYINSIDTPLFHKGRMLYGAAHATFAARESEPLIVTEGYLDVIACWQAGIKGAVAPLGTALTEDQIVLLWRMIPDDVKCPILCFDGDEAGRRAASRAVERIIPLLKAGHSAKIVFLPEGEDPDTLIRSQGRGAFENKLAQGRELVEFIFEQEIEGRNFKTPEERASLNQKLEDIANRIPDRDVQYYYRTEFRNKIRTLFAGVNVSLQYNKRKFSTHSLKAAVSSPQEDKDTLIQRILICAAITHPALFPDIEERLGALSLQHNALSKIRDGLFSCLDSQIELDFEQVKSHLISVGLEGELAYTVNDSVFTHAGFRPETDLAIVLEKWNAFWSLIESRAEQEDLSQSLSKQN